MSFIHELFSWPNLTWDAGKLAPRCSEVRHQEGRLLGKMEVLGFPFREEAHLRALTAEVVQSSAIEGENLDAEAVRSSIARRLGIDAGGLSPASTRDVDGIVEMMLDATQHSDQPLTAERLFGWHAALFPTGHSGLRKITVGAWRTAESGPMQVVSGAYGKETIHFEAPSAERLSKEMARFLEWFAASEEIDPVLRAGVAHLWFVTIHPFEDGNGRIARAIADMALARPGKGTPRFYSMSAQIEAERKDYYLSLERSQRDGTDITAWLEWFIGCCGRSVNRADRELTDILGKAKAWQRINAIPVNERQRAILNRLFDGFEGKLSTAKYAKLAKCSQDTAWRDIKTLVDRGILVQEEGGGRSTRYRLADLSGFG